MARVVFNNVTKEFGSVKALNNINLTIEDGEFVVLVGPSGCGKSTLMRTVAGLEQPTEGEILIDEKRVDDLTPKDRDVAMVFQSYALYPHMKVYDNLAFPLKMRGLSKKEIEKKVHTVASLLGIMEMLERLPKQLSGGQRQRVALGRAIVREPKVFLMDEPLSNLDAKLRVQMRAEIAELHEQLKTTIIYVTHDQVEAMTMGTRLVVLLNGEIQQVGTPTELYNSPINTFVAGFIGSPSMNFMNCKVEKYDNDLYLIGDNWKAKLDYAQKDKLTEFIGRTITIGIRPEAINIVAYSTSDSSDFVVEGTIELVELLGFEQYIHVNINNSVRLNARAESNGPKLHRGNRVKMNFNSKDIHFFDSATTMRISG